MALPRENALGSLRRLRSPAWAVALPGGIVVGTFGPLGGHSFAVCLILLAALATPPLAAVAVLALARLIPAPWVLAGFACMCAVDVALIAAGVGQPAATIIARVAGRARCCF